MLIEEFGDEYVPTWNGLFLLNEAHAQRPYRNVSSYEQVHLQVRDQMGPCGITCATCDLGNGTVAEIASKLKQYLQMYGISMWAPQVPSGSYVDFSQLDKSLSWVHTYARCFGCEQGVPTRLCDKKMLQGKGIRPVLAMSRPWRMHQIRPTATSRPRSWRRSISKSDWGSYSACNDTVSVSISQRTIR